MSIEHLVTIGTSAGGIEALKCVAASLPKDFPAPILVVIHTSPHSPAIVSDILSRSGPLPATNARNFERLRAGWIYVAPPDHHLLVEPGIMRLTRGPRENRFRPAIDPLFRSAAQAYGPGVVGVILTGNLDDGTAGLWAVKQLGGTAVVQDPADALFPGMPSSAARHVNVDHSVPLAGIGPLLTRLTSTSVQPREERRPPELDRELDMAKGRNAIDAGIERFGELSKFECPECHGVLLEIKESDRLLFRCHAGHAYSGESIFAEVSDRIEEALWNAVRAVQESDVLLKHQADHHCDRGDEADSQRLAAKAAEEYERAERLRAVLTERPPTALK